MVLVQVTDITRGWRALTDDQQTDAEDLIEAALAWITAPARRPDLAEVDADPVAKRVVVEVVRIALAAPAEFAGHTSYSKTTGPFGKSGTVATPAGTLVFTAQHAQMLGISDEPLPVAEFGDPFGYRYPPPGAVLP